MNERRASTHHRDRGAAGRQFALRSALLLLIVPLLCVTVFVVAFVADVNLRRSAAVLAEMLGDQVSAGTAQKVEAMLEPARIALAECRNRVQRGLIDPDNDDALADFIVERFRPEARLSWLSYGDENGRFIGARRGPDGRVILNRSWLADGRTLMIEEVVHTDGRREWFRQDDDFKYDPRVRPWYTNALESDPIAWTGPYVWTEGEIGLTASIAVRQADKIIGVFTADFELTHLSAYLSASRLGEGTAFIVARDGTRIAGPVDRGAKRLLPAPLADAAIAAMPRPLASLPIGMPEPFTFIHDGTEYAAVCEFLNAPGGVEWATLLVVPTEPIFGFVYRNAQFTVIIGLLALLVAIVAARLVAGRIAGPLGEIADDLERVGRFELSGDRAPPSLVREIDVVGRAIDRMKASLRSFSHYVPRDLVRELLLNGREAELGAEDRELTIFFSDIEGFSRISETVPTERIVAILGRYFETVDQEVTDADGTIDKFIGDGVLAFFNAPRSVPDHAAAASRTALQVLERLAPLLDLWHAPAPLRPRTRIGLHTGRVLVGNLGTPTRFQYTVIGDAVNLAAGLQLLNKAYCTSILASQETRDAAGTAFEWRRVDRVAIKGRQGSGFVYELLGVAGQVNPHILAARDAHEAALEAYLERRFEDAATGFAKAAELWPSDGASRVMLARAQRFVIDPPAETWEGLFNFSGLPGET